MRPAAIFRALAAIDSGPVGAQPQRRGRGRGSCRPFRRAPGSRSCGSHRRSRARTRRSGRPECGSRSRWRPRRLAWPVLDPPPPLLADDRDRDGASFARLGDVRTHQPTSVGEQPSQHDRRKGNAAGIDGALACEPRAKPGPGRAWRARSPRRPPAGRSRRPRKAASRAWRSPPRAAPAGRAPIARRAAAEEKRERQKASSARFIGAVRGQAAGSRDRPRRPRSARRSARGRSAP